MPAPDEGGRPHERRLRSRWPRRARSSGRAAVAAGIAALGAGRKCSCPVGRLVASRTMPKPVEGTLLDAEGQVLIYTGDGITALDPDSGTLLWGYPVHGSIPVFRYLSTRHQLVGHGHTLAALDLVTGKPGLAPERLAGSWGDPAQHGSAGFDRRPADAQWVCRTRPRQRGHVVGLHGTSAGTIVREFFRLHDLKLLLLVAKPPRLPSPLWLSRWIPAPCAGAMPRRSGNQ